MTKRCTCCKRELPTSAFNGQKRSRDGLQSTCLECMTSIIASRRYRKLAATEDGRAALEYHMARHARLAEYARLALAGQLPKNPNRRDG